MNDHALSGTAERRAAEPATREDMWAAMSESQRATVSKLESHGWQLCFVRKGPNNNSEPVVSQASTGSLGIVAPEGGLVPSPSLRIRRG